MGCAGCERQEKLFNTLSSISALYSGDEIYMDYNATTPVLPECLGAFEQSCRRNWGNPSSFHIKGITAWKELEKNRIDAAAYFNAGPDRLFFCSSGSEAVFTAINGLAEEGGSTFFITTEVEHSAVLKNLSALIRSDCIKILGVNSNGEIDISELREALDENKKLKCAVIYSPVNHETGAIQPVKKIYDTASEYGAVTVLDAVQAAARMSTDEWKSCCDIFAASSHKLYAPKGCGILYTAEKIKLKGFRNGGSQEKGLFPGTENMPGIAAFAAALRYLKKNFTGNQKYLKILSGEGMQILKNLSFEVNIETPENCVPGVLCISIPEIFDMEKLLTYLSQKKICVSRFSACSENLNGPSAVLLAMGREKRRAEKSLRISLGIYSKREDFFIFSNALSEYIRYHNIR